MTKKNNALDRALDTLVRLRGTVGRALTRNAKLSGRYTAAMKRDFAQGDEAGKRLAEKYFGSRRADEATGVVFPAKRR